MNDSGQVLPCVSEEVIAECFSSWLEFRSSRPGEVLQIALETLQINQKKFNQSTETENYIIFVDICYGAIEECRQFDSSCL